MLQIENKTPFAANLNICPDKNGIDSVIGVVKASFDLSRDDNRIQPSKIQPPVIRSEEYWGEPGKSSIKYASELSLEKPSTDIVMNCHAISPKGKPVKSLQVELSVGRYRKKVDVFGERFWERALGVFHKTSPRPFNKLPVIYENAFGGTDEKSPKNSEPRNPVGCGIKTGESLANRVPNVESPDQPIITRSGRPEPAGFGYIAPHWSQRAQYAGTYDDKWRKQRAPFLPKDFDCRFFQAAHPDLITKSYLKGGEEVYINNVHPAGPLAFPLPRVSFEFVFHLDGEKVIIQPVMDTLLIEPDHMRFSMIWRASTHCDKKSLRMETLEINAESQEVAFD